MTSRLAFLLLLGACGSAPSTPPKPAAPPAPSVPVSAPHTQTIAAIALTATAALTADTAGHVRLWPTLDGTREPIVVNATGVRSVALASTADGFSAALLGTTLEIVQLGNDGSVRGRASLGVVTQVVAFDHGFLALTRDHHITSLDSAGRIRATFSDGTLALVAAGERVFAARGSTNVTALTPVRGTALGADIALPEAMNGLALSPSGSRLAGLSASGEALLLDMAPSPAVIARVKNVAANIQFLDDDRVNLGNRVATLGTPSDDALLAAFIPQTWATLGELRASAQGVELAITRRGVTKWLGWQAMGAAHLDSGDGATLMFSPGLVWLDNDLHATRFLATEPWQPPDVRQRLEPIALEGRWVLCSTGPGIEGSLEGLRFAICDVDSGATTPLGVFDNVNPVYDAATHTLAVGDIVRVRRWRMDPSTGTTTPLPDVAAGIELAVFDPQKANHTALVTKRFRSIRAYRDGTEPASTVDVSEDSELVGADDRGTIFVIAPPIHPFSEKSEIPAQRILAYRDGARIASFAVAPARAAAVSTSRVATGSSGIAVYDHAGALQWRNPAPGITELAFSRDGATLFAGTNNGIYAFDAATGRRRATACGWGFGLHDAPPPHVEPTGPSACTRE